MGSRLGILKVAAARIGLDFNKYLRQLATGKKWCHKCQSWKPSGQFGKDRHRADSYHAVCKSCRYIRKTIGPTQAERRQMLALNKKWCSKCKTWQSSKSVRGGTCREHANEYAREKYSMDSRYRLERRQHAHSRKRRIEPVPPEAQEILLEEFKGKCAYCDKPATTWDHVVPISRGGRTSPSNIVPACTRCNSSKNNSELFEWLERTGRTPSHQLFDRIILVEAGLFP